MGTQSKRMKLSEPEVPTTDSYQLDEETTKLFQHLSELPMEVLIMIFEALPSQVVLKLEKSKLDWVKRASKGTKYGDFAWCCNLSYAELKHFVQVRTNHLHSLLVDTLVPVEASTLVNLISMCHQITVLSIPRFSMKIKDYFKLFELQHLTDLYCYISYAPTSERMDCNKVWNVSKSKDFRILSVRLSDAHVLGKILRPSLLTWPHLVHLVIKLKTTPNNFEIMKIADKYMKQGDFPNLTRLDYLKVLVSPGGAVEKLCIAPLLKWMFHSRQVTIPWRKFWIATEWRTMENMIASKTTWQDFGKMKSLFYLETSNVIGNTKPETLPHLQELVLGTDEFNQDVAKFVVESSQKTLRSFSLFPIEEPLSLNAVVVNYLLTSCCHLTHIDLQNCHVDRDSNFSVCNLLTILKGLEDVCFTCCAITNVPLLPAVDEDVPLFTSRSERKRIQKTRYASAIKYFNKMVQSCPSVQNFDLAECFDTQCNQPSKGKVFFCEILSNIYMWKNLKHLEFSNINNFVSFAFLEKVAAFCPEFCTLTMINIKGPSTQLMRSLATTLIKAKKLTKLRIVHPEFNFKSRAFWDAVAKSTNLHILCLCSNMAYENAEASAKYISKCILQSPYLHVVHLFGKRMDEVSHLFNPIRSALRSKVGKSGDLENSGCFKLQTANWMQDKCSNVCNSDHMD